MATDVVFQETNVVVISFWSGRKQNEVTPRRRHYQQCDPQTIILLKGFFLLTALECVRCHSNELERRMRCSLIVFN